MAVGDSSVENMFSYIAIGRETSTSYGTYSTATAGLEFISASMKTSRESKILEQVVTDRIMSKQIRTNKMIEGEIEWYAGAKTAADVYLLLNAFGGGVPTSATATGETAGGAAFSHEVLVGDYSGTFTGLSINHRKGDTASGFVYEYSGVRINEFTVTAEMEEALKMNASVVAIDSTKTSNDVASALSASAADNCLNFVDGRVSVESSFSALTSTSFWHVQSAELKISNNLKSDNESRRIGSEVLDVLPPGVMNIEVTTTMRFNTTTAYDAMLNNTQYSMELEFLGDTLSTSIIRQGMLFELPRVYIMDAGDPEVAGPDGMLTSEVTWQVLRDVSSASGYAIKATVTNDTSSYA